MRVTEVAGTAGTSQQESLLTALLARFSIDRANISLLLALGAVAAGVQFNDQLVGLTGDNAQYILLGLSLATGQTYANAEYPWGYPALLTPVLAVTGPENVLAAIPWLKLITILLFLGSLPLIYMLFRARSSALSAFVAAMLFAVNGTTLLYANDVMSEIPFVFVTFAAMLFWQRKLDPWLRDSDSASTPWATLLTVGLLIEAAYYVRTVGLALMGGALLVLLWHRKVRAALVMAVLLGGLALPWLLFSSAAGQPTYTTKLLLRDPYNPQLGQISSVGEFGTRLVTTADLYVSHVFPAMVLPDPAPAPLRSLVAPLLVALMVLGLGWRLATRRGLTEVYTLLFLLVLFAWPWRADRFMLPVYPLLLFFVLEGIAYLLRAGRSVERMAPAARVTLVTLGVVLFAMPNLWLAGQAGATNIRYLAGEAPPSGHTPDWQAYFAACDWLNKHTPPGSVVMSRKSTLTQIYAGRPSVLIPLIPPGQYPDFVRQNHVAYIIEDGFAWSTQTVQYLRPALKANPGTFKLVDTITKPVTTRIWQVTP